MSESKNKPNLEQDLRSCLEYLVENEEEDFFDWCFAHNKRPSSEMKRKKFPHVYVSALRISKAMGFINTD